MTLDDLPNVVNVIQVMICRVGTLIHVHKAGISDVTYVYPLPAVQYLQWDIVIVFAVQDHPDFVLWCVSKGTSVRDNAGGLSYQTM